MKDIYWNRNFVYGIGLIATDGCLSSDGRHIEFTSKDLELVTHIKGAFKLTNKITQKSRGGSIEKKYHRIQFGNVQLYNFLINIGLSPKKSHTLGALRIPKYFLADFLRGVIDGDGSIGYFMHPESKRKQFRIRISSASKSFLTWLDKEITRFLGIKGLIRRCAKVYELRYYRADSKELAKCIYCDKNALSLKRKFKIAELLMGESGETGTRASLRSSWGLPHGGSTPPSRTIS